MSSEIRNEDCYKFLGLYKWERPNVPRPYSIQLDENLSIEIDLYCYTRTNPLPSFVPDWKLIL